MRAVTNEFCDVYIGPISKCRYVQTKLVYDFTTCIYKERCSPDTCKGMGEFYYLVGVEILYTNLCIKTIAHWR